MKQAELEAKYRKLYGQKKQPEQPSGRYGLTEEEAKKNINQQTAFGRGVVQGAREFGQGLNQASLARDELIGRIPEGEYLWGKPVPKGYYQGLTPKESYEDYTRKVAEQRNQYENNPNYLENPFTQETGRMLGGSIPFAPLGGFTGGALQAGLSYVPQEGSRTSNAIIGGVTSKLGDYILKAFTKGVNAVGGKFKNKETEKLIEKSAEEGVGITARQAKPLNPAKNTPEMQNIQAKTSSQRQLERAKNEMLKTNFGGLKKVKEVAKGKGYRAERAKELLKDIENAGDDWQRIIETSGNLKLFRSKLITDKAYNKVGKLAKSHGAVDLKPYVQEIDKLIKLEKKGGDPNERVLALLYKTREGLHLKKPATPASKLLDIEGNPMIAAEPEKQVLKDLNYDQVRKLRSKMSKRISDFYKKPGSELISTEEVIAAQRLKNKTTYMLDNFAKTHGSELEKARKQADLLHKRLVAPYKDKALAKSLSNAAPDEIYNKFIVKGISEEGYGTTRAKKFYAALDNRGRAAVRYGMSKQSFDKSFDVNTGEFNPAKYANELRNLTTSRGVFFNKEQKNEVEGLANLFAHIGNKTAGTQGAANAGTPYIIASLTGLGVTGGYANAYPEEGSNAVVAGAGTAATLASGKMAGGFIIKKLMNTDAGRNFLLASSKIQANTPAMQDLIDGFIKTSGAGLRKEILDSFNKESKQEEQETGVPITNETSPQGSEVEYPSIESIENNRYKDLTQSEAEELYRENFK